MKIQARDLWPGHVFITHRWIGGKKGKPFQCTVASVMITEEHGREYAIIKTLERGALFIPAGRQVERIGD